MTVDPGHEDDKARRLSSKAGVGNTELRWNPPWESYVEMEDEWRTLTVKLTEEHQRGILFGFAWSDSGRQAHPEKKNQVVRKDHFQ